MDLNIDVQAEYERLRTFYDETKALLDRPDDVLFGVNAAVSGWSPAEHLYHVWLANGRSLKAVLLMVQEALPLSDKGRPNAFGRMVLTEERFERGRGEAPDNVRPPETVGRDALVETLDRSHAKLGDLASHLATLQQVTGRLQHPSLGLLDGPEWLRFVRVHSEHHHAIIRDILHIDSSRST